MSDAAAQVQRIAAELEKHRAYGLDCKCGRPINSDADWSTHAAAAVVTALGISVVSGQAVKP